MLAFSTISYISNFFFFLFHAFNVCVNLPAQRVPPVLAEKTDGNKKKKKKDAPTVLESRKLLIEIGKGE